MGPTQIGNRKQKTLQQYNIEVKVLLSSLISISLFPAMPGNIKQKGISTDIISESMGHQNLAITQAYLKELDNSLVDEAMEVLL